MFKSCHCFSVFSISMFFLLVGCDVTGGHVNSPREYTVVKSKEPLICEVDLTSIKHSIDKRIFGTNLEWFNNAGGIATRNEEKYNNFVDLSVRQGITNFRFPGGILADYYDWRLGIGPIRSRREERHPTDSGKSVHYFGSPEFFEFLEKTGSKGLITVNAGTGSPRMAAEWIRYANDDVNPERAADGFPDPIGIQMWEVGNELYLPGNPKEKNISTTPEEYAHRFNAFAHEMKKADPDIELLGLGVGITHVGPNTRYPDWNERVLPIVADNIDYLAVHNAYFPMLYGVKQPDVETVYKSLWASPESVKRNLDELDRQVVSHQKSKEINLAITEWGALFSLPMADKYWFDHVKTIGAGVYIGRMLQVFMESPRLKIANYFKFTDQTFMGWVDYNGEPKVPFTVFELFSKFSGDQRLRLNIESPTYSVPQFSIMNAESDVETVTAVATKDTESGKVFVNFVNRSMDTQYQVLMKSTIPVKVKEGVLHQISADEPTAHNGRDIKGQAYSPVIEPYRTNVKPIKIVSKEWLSGDLIELPPFSVSVLEVSFDK